MAVLDVPSLTNATHSNGSKISRIPNEPLSNWLGFSALIFCSSAIFVMLLTRMLDGIILPKVYGLKRLEALTHRDRRSFIFHHVAGPVKLLSFAAGVYPCYQIVVGDADFSTMIARGSSICMGDSLLVAVQLFCAMYVAELQYRAETISWLSVAHHIVTVLTANVAFGLSSYVETYKEASVEIYLCCIWGFFDMIATAPLDPLLIARRLIRETHPRFIRNGLYTTAAWSLLTTIAEIIVTFMCLAWSWPRIGTEVRVFTPLCFIVWVISQGHLVYILLNLAKKQKSHMVKHEGIVEEEPQSVQRKSESSSTSSQK